MSVGLLSLLLGCALPMVWVVLVYNRLVELRDAVHNAYAQVDLQLKRRHDLVPSIVEVANLHRRHERPVIEAVIAARQGAASARATAAALGAEATAIVRLDAAEDLLSRRLAPLFAVARSDPGLQVDGAFAALADALAGTEHRIALARTRYNHAVTDNNDAIGSGPARLIAALAGARRGAPLRSTARAIDRRPVPVEA